MTKSLCAFAAIVCSLTSGCLGFNTEDGHPNNIIAAEGLAYASLAGEGFAIIDPSTAMILSKVAPASATSRVDDLAADGVLLFALDASDGFLTVWSLADPLNPTLLDGPIEVPVGPFAGVAATSGVVVVSGGTNDLTVRGYTGSGILSESHGALDLDRGQPDVLLSPNGRVAFVSTHFSDDVDGAEFGVTALTIENAAVPPVVGSRTGIEGAGFTDGTANPANFPIETALSGDRLLVAHGGGLTVVDVSDPRAMQVVGSVELTVRATSVDVDQDRAFVVGIEPEPQLVIVDVSAPTTPTVLETIALADDAVPTGVVVTETEVLIAANGGGVIRHPR